MKLLLFSDLHLRDESADVCFTVLREIRREALERRVRSIAFLGDFYHVRHTLPVRLLNAVKDELLEWSRAGLELTLLPGNHDQIDVQGRNALEVLDEIEGVHVFNQPHVNDLGLWIPYRHEETDIERAIAMGRENNAAVVFMHGALKGATMNHLVQNEDGVDAKNFLGFKKVLLGHYHKRQTLGPEGLCQYIGSPWQTRADEAGQPKGFAIWDGSVLEFVDRDFGPRHHSIQIENMDELDQKLKEVRPGDKLKILVSKEEDITKASALLERLRVRGVVEPVVASTCAPRLGIRKEATYQEYAQAYVEREHNDLDPHALMAVFEVDPVVRTKISLG